MKFMRVFFMIFGIIALIGAIAAGIAHFFKPSDMSAIENMGAISQGMLEQSQLLGKRLGQRMAWVMVFVSASLQVGAWIAAVCKTRKLKKGEYGSAKTLELLEAIDIYYDLPLYFGLLGSVGSFIMITFYPDAGLMFAYASTAMGIIVSVILRLAFHTPFKQQLLLETSETK